MSELSSKHLKLIKQPKGYDFESLQSKSMFQTKSEDDIKNDPYQSWAKGNSSIEDIAVASVIQEGESQENSNQWSEVDNSQLKQTADFFRPSPKNVDQKRFSFGVQKIVVPKKYEGKQK